MFTTSRMRTLETTDGKGMDPLYVLDILESFMDDPLIYYPEISIANLNSKGKRKKGFLFSPDLFAKTLTRSNFTRKEFQSLMSSNDYLATAVGAFDEADKERVSIATVKKGPDEISMIFNVFHNKNVPDLEALLDRIR